MEFKTISFNEKNLCKEAYESYLVDIEDLNLSYKKGSDGNFYLFDNADNSIVTVFETFNDLELNLLSFSDEYDNCYWKTRLQDKVKKDYESYIKGFQKLEFSELIKRNIDISIIIFLYKCFQECVFTENELDLITVKNLLKVDNIFHELWKKCSKTDFFSWDIIKDEVKEIIMNF